jgi:hypothetical protein
MKRLVIFSSIIISLLLTTCEKGYKDEIFIEKYRSIYGQWQFQFAVGETGFITGNYTIEFIRYGLFRYKDGKEGKIKIVQQDENTLLLDFDSLIPNVRYANVWISNSGDTLDFTPNNGIMSLYTRIK